MNTRAAFALVLLFGASLAGGCPPDDGIVTFDIAEPADLAPLVDASEPVPDEFEPTFDVTELFDMAALTSPEGLNLQIKKETVKATAGGGWLVPFAFRSQVWMGNAWDHPSRLFVPKQQNPALAGTWAILQEGTEDLDTGLSVEEEFGRLTADYLGVPIVLLAKVPTPSAFAVPDPPDLAVAFPDCFDRTLVEDELAECATALAIESREFKWSLEVRLARAYIRAMTAAAAIPGKLGDIEVGDVPLTPPERFVLGGAGKRGMNLWLVALVDDRTAGVWVAAADRGNLEAHYENMADVWTGGYPQSDPDAFLAFYRSEFGHHWRTLVDPWAYTDRIEGVDAMILRGTNDPQYPLGSYALYADRLPSGHSVVLAPNQGHGFASETDLVAWRAFIARVGAGRPVLRPAADFREDGGTVLVDVALSGGGGSQVTPTQARLWYTSAQQTGDDKDLRDAVWTSVDLAQTAQDGDGMPVYGGSFTPTTTHWAAYVEIRDVDAAGLAGTGCTSPVLSWEL